MGGTTVISERQFAGLYTSFWSTALPLAEATVREMNLRAERFFDPLEADSPTAFNGFVNELAFRVAESCHAAGLVAIASESVSTVYAPTEVYIMRLPRAVVPSNASERDAATKDAMTIAQRLLEMVSRCRGDRGVWFRPSFQGSGVLDACEGDILIGEDLWEVKSGDRHFRQTDIRQILVYCALNYAARVREITHFSLVNPRAGVMACGTVTDLAYALAGCDSNTLFDEIVGFLSSQDVST
jgi:hypothetical protein